MINFFHFHSVNFCCPFNHQHYQCQVMESEEASKENQLIVKYFKYGYTYSKICSMLHQRHEISLSLRTLKRRMKSIGLKRRSIVESPIEEIAAAIILECTESGSCLGYRSMWARLKTKYHFTVKRGTVSHLLSIIDPGGVEGRKRRRLHRRIYKVPGPNFMIHIDGHDKLKTYGFSIHGATDGYSRKVLWLKVADTNKNPKVTAKYFLQTIKKYKKLPTKVRCDKGTENVIIAKLQKALRYEHEDTFAGLKSFTWSKSVHNQRIESYWNQLINHCTSFWIKYFKKMIDDGHLDTDNNVNIEILRYCYGPIIESDLERTRKEWNNHKIRSQLNRDVVAGEPNYLYFCPEDFGVVDCSKPFLEEDIDNLLACEEYCIDASLFCPEVEKFIAMIARETMINPDTVQEAEKLYLLAVQEMLHYDLCSVEDVNSGDNTC